VVLGCCRRGTRMLQAWYYDAAGVVLGCCRRGTRMLHDRFELDFDNSDKAIDFLYIKVDEKQKYYNYNYIIYNT